MIGFIRRLAAVAVTAALVLGLQAPASAEKVTFTDNHKPGNVGFGVDLADDLDHVCAGRKLLYQAHVDALYATYLDDQLATAVVDGQAVRPHDDVCLRLAPDANSKGEEVSRLVVPDDPAFADLGEPGTILWYAPRSVSFLDQWRPIWAGMGAFDPNHENEVPGNFVDDEVTFELVDFDGPGDMNVFYKIPTMEKPEYSLRTGDDPKTTFTYTVGGHGHYDWTFTEPGIYTLTVQVSATTTDGEELVSEPQEIIWLVGSDSDVDLPEGTTENLNEITTTAEDIRAKMKLSAPSEESESKDNDDASESEKSEEPTDKGKDQQQKDDKNTQKDKNKEDGKKKEPQEKTEKKPSGKDNDLPRRKKPSARPGGTAQPAEPQRAKVVDGKVSHLVTEGHMDLMAFANPTDGFQAMLKDGADPANEVLYPSGTFAFVVSNATRVSLPDKAREGLGDFPAEVYELPQVQYDGIPWLGFSTLMEPGGGIDTSAPVLVDIAAFEGPGRMVASEASLFSQEVRLDSSDPSKLIQYGPLDHNHLSFWFTDPGSYKVTFRFTATAEGGGQESRNLEATFLVGDDTAAEGAEQIGQNYTPGTEGISRPAPQAKGLPGAASAANNPAPALSGARGTPHALVAGGRAGGTAGAAGGNGAQSGGGKGGTKAQSGGGKTTQSGGGNTKSGEAKKNSEAKKNNNKKKSAEKKDSSAKKSDKRGIPDADDSSVEAQSEDLEGVGLTGGSWGSGVLIGIGGVSALVGIVLLVLAASNRRVAQALQKAGVDPASMHAPGPAPVASAGGSAKLARKVRKPTGAATMPPESEQTSVIDTTTPDNKG